MRLGEHPERGVEVYDPTERDATDGATDVAGQRKLSAIAAKWRIDSVSG